MFRVKIATEPWEFDQIHALNHRTFAEEIPRYEANASRILVDRFHDENTYVIAARDGRVAGMIAIRGRRPFSLDDRLPDLDSYLPPGRSICELRLLAVEKTDRRSRIVPMIFDFVWRHCLREGFDLALISGTTRQLKLYGHLGFMPFGPLVGSGAALFQPMMLTLERFAPRAPDLFRAAPGATAPPSAASFLPGPVPVRDEVRRAFEQPPESHRSPAFVAELAAVRTSLCALVGAARAAIILGTGTSANDAVAGQLSLERGPGLILTNGEFGERLVDHACRFRLAHEVVAEPWGNALDLERVAGRASVLRPTWLWFVHAETSTGVLNDLEALKAICAARGIKLCADTISSIGNAPVDLHGVYFGSGVSGKGLGSIPGLAFVFYSHAIAPAALPRYLDLALYADDTAVPFTHSSNLIHALGAALADVDWPARFREVADATTWLRARLSRLGMVRIGDDDHAAPGVVTIAVSPDLRSSAIAEAMARQGFLVSAHSRYLAERNWIQICPMAETSRARLADVTNALYQLCCAAPAGV